MNKEFFSILLDDCREGAEVWAEQLTDASKRAYVRTVFSFIEGNSHRLKLLWLECHKEGYIKLSEKELNCINGFKIEEDGQKKIIKSAFKDSIKSSFSIASNAFNIKNPLITTGDDWRNFSRALEIRHRLTHPKTIEDLDVSIQNMQVVESACEFYRKATIELVTKL
ncbi:hypothetical protein [Aliivibrio fischeri]|uniref:hypothetical protein n=1 Tax=Aliivibrio fischeri TaxID=668 RepID=UPI0012DA927C|nr:hypothetical protein [Aliivibrio fischeri]MUJ39655.1 hypothetical protein [Aliivibrio fischeri]